MELKVLSDEAIKDARLKSTGYHPLAQWRAVAREAEKERDKEWIKWGDSECPHGINQKTVRRKCFKCWLELSRSIEILDK